MSVVIVNPSNGDTVPTSFSVVAYYSDFAVDTTITFAPNGKTLAAPAPDGSCTSDCSSEPAAGVTVSATAAVGGSDSITVTVSADALMSADPVGPSDDPPPDAAGAATTAGGAAAGRHLLQTGYVDLSVTPPPSYVVSVAYRVSPGRAKAVVAVGSSTVQPNGKWAAKLEPSLKLNQPNVFYVVQSTAYTAANVKIVSVSKSIH